MRSLSTAEQIACEATGCETWEELRVLVCRVSYRKVGSEIRVNAVDVVRWDYDDGSWLTIRDRETTGEKHRRCRGWKLRAFSYDAKTELSMGLGLVSA